MLIALDTAPSRSPAKAVPQALASVPEADTAAFEALHAEVSVPLWRYLRRTGGSDALADDLVQESFLRFLRDPKAPSDPASARPYLYTVATNLLRDRWRAKERHRRLQPEAPDRIDSHARPSQLQGDVQSILDQLTDRERSLVWLAHVDGYHHAEIAEILGLSPASIKVLLHRAKKRLRALLAESRSGGDL